MKKALLFVLPVLLAVFFAAYAAGEGAAAEKTQPCIRITTEGQQPILSRDEYVPAAIEVLNCDEAYQLDEPGEIKVRGNSTSQDEHEKPYRIRFREKQNMLGLHGGRKYRSWVLQRSFWNLAPDYMAFRLAEAIFAGKYYSSDCTFVNLYINGSYMGIYVLCEQNQAAKGRIDIHEPETEETRTDTGYLLEMDNYPGEHPYFSIPGTLSVTDIAGQSRMIRSRNYSVKSRINCGEQLEFIKRHLSSVFLVLYHAAVNGDIMGLDSRGREVNAEDRFATPYEAVEAVIDVDSLACMLILEELVQNYDVGEGSFFMAVDFSRFSRYPRLTFLGPWDFNWAYYEPADGGYYASTFQKPNMGDRSNCWFILAMKLDGFRQLVREKWKQLSENGELEKAVSRVVADCEALAGDLGPENAWKIEMARNIAAFVRGRIRWLDGAWLQ